ncbi:hypothetical protein G6L37_06445 [Agrobacterium rubi]|nr:hypothetical protein [Agrobacterium rubi]NTF25002.1 hypothetical protein [Agrobacterium rubi]
MIDLNDFEGNRDLVTAYGYCVMTWEDFVAAPDIPAGLLERATEETADREQDRDWVIYDPDGNAEDWMLTGDKDAIIRTTVEEIIRQNPQAGPLSGAVLDISPSSLVEKGMPR